jgi:hypothetical protein
MTASHKTPTPDKQELRKFGFVFAAGLVLIFGLFFPWILEKPSPSWPWIVAAVFAGSALILPQMLKPVFLLWMKIGHALGWINTRIILGIVFFLLFAPVALLFHLLGKDPMHRQLDANASTYRVNSEKPPRERMERPF